MAANVTLTIVEGSLKGKKYTFRERTTCLIGRANECKIKLPSDRDHRFISRYHCFLDINPPDIRIRDFGSKNGTYVNDQKIGQRQQNQTPSEGSKISFPEYDLKMGDRVLLGSTIFQVQIALPAVTSDTIDIAKIKIKPAPPPHFPNLLGFIKNLLQRANQGEKELANLKHYKIIEKLGQGGCGVVYLALNQTNGELVALKILLPQIAASPRHIEKFQREIANTQALNHPNVVKLRDFGYCDGIFFFTLEYCEMGSVLQLMQQKGRPLTVGESLPIILQILDGLHYAHHADIPYVKLHDGTIAKGRGLVHRDIKPGNIFLTQISDRCIAKIGDYGLAKAFDRAGLSGQTLTGSSAGTPAYMPRQQVIDFKYAKPAVDVWATAATLYTLLTGDIPRNLTQTDPLLAVLRTNPIPIRERNPNIPKSLAEVIDRALIDIPDIPFQTALEFKQALENF
ncbi:MAG: protein kinase [Cyanobacteria bacterium P01_E01_bin.42]